MKKFFAFIAAAILSLPFMTACGGDGSNAGVKKYISTFDWYRDCLIIPVSSWVGPLVEEGLIETEWNQEKTEYISQGKGSCRVTTREGSTRYRGHMMTNSELVPIDDINGATLVSLDVYNTENFAIDVSIEIICGAQTVVSVTKTCAPKSWTTVSSTIEQEEEFDWVNSYVLTLENKVNDQTFTLYLDNFYLLFKK
jgi:hypothetical protein